MSGSYQASAEELAALAKRVLDVDSQTQGTLRQVRSTVDDVSAVWRGAAADAFNKLMVRFGEDAEKLQQALRSIAEQVDSSSVTYARQEEEAAQASSSIINRMG